MIHELHEQRLRGRRRDRRAAGSPPVDVYDRDDHYVVLWDIPGLDPGSLDVQVDGGTVLIRGHRERSAVHDADRVAAERPCGVISRRVELDRPADGRGITATYTDGVLTLRIPATDQDGAPDQRRSAHVLHAVA
jgi:HSP20 family protein